MKTVTVTSDNKNDAYTATVLLFNNVAQMASNNVAGWELEGSATYSNEGYFFTKYNNGKMYISAETINGHHTYRLGPLD